MAGASPENETSGKCFSGILSRILCIRSLPTHPSDQLPDDNDSKSFSDRQHQQTAIATAPASNSPGVVARLMGLESMPGETVEAAPKGGRSLGSFLRSRSVNFIDFLPQLDTQAGDNSQHRRVRTSVSFREAIGFDREKHDFFVLCFDSDDFDEKKQGILVKRSENRVVEKSKKSVGEVIVTTKRKNSSDNNAKVNVNSVNVNRKVNNLSLKEKKAELMKKPVDLQRVSAADESKPNNRKKKIVMKNKYVCSNKIQPEFGSSTLHHHHHPPKISPSKSEQSYGKLQKCAKKDQLPKPKNKLVHHHRRHQQQQQQQHKRRAVEKAMIKENRASKAVEENVSRARKRENVGSCENVLAEICRLAEDYASECWWSRGNNNGVVLNNFEDSEEVCMQFGQHILDVLLDDVVGELVMIHNSMNLNL